LRPRRNTNKYCAERYKTKEVWDEEIIVQEKDDDEGKKGTHKSLLFLFLLTILWGTKISKSKLLTGEKERKANEQKTVRNLWDGVHCHLNLL
jgi:hypothetical protein